MMLNETRIDRRLILIALLAAFVPGCEDSGSGDVLFRWAVGLTGTCEEARLTQVEVRLEDGGGSRIASAVTPCGEGRVLLEAVPEGTYRARLTAYDDVGAPAYEAVVGGVSVGPVVGAVDPVFARLAPRPASARVVWFFHGGRLCSAYGVDQVRVRLFSSDRERVVKESACDAGDVLLDGLEDGRYGIRVEGMTVEGIATHAFTVANVEIRPGHAVEVDAPLTPCGDDCR